MDNSQKIEPANIPYDEFFGIHGKVKYDIQEEWGFVNGEEWGYVVYVDNDIDVDWIDKREGYWSDEEKALRNVCIAKLNVVQQTPCDNLPEKTKLEFKKMLGAAYVLALNKQYTDAEEKMRDAQIYVDQRNKEAARYMYLLVAGVFAILSIGFMVLDVELWEWRLPWVITATMGILGAFVSVWSRYGKEVFTGLAAPRLHYMEAISRMVIGAIFAAIALCVVKLGWLLPNIDEINAKFYHMIVGFIAGFSERFVPSLLEKFVEKSEK